MEKKFPGSPRHIERMRQKGVSREAPLLVSSATIIGAGGAAWYAMQWWICSIIDTTQHCWGPRPEELPGCLRRVGSIGWVGWLTVTTVGATAALATLWMVKRPRIQAANLRFDLGRLNPVQFVDRLRSCPGPIGGSAAGIIIGALVLWWIAEGNRFDRFLPQSGEEVRQLISRAGMGVGLWILGNGLISAAIGVWRFRKKTRMSEIDLRQEHKDDSGDPHQKSAQRQLHQALMREELVKAIRRSTVVLVAPMENKRGLP